MEICNEIITNLERQLSAQQVKIIKSKQLHLGIFTAPYLTDMIEGKKTIELRFSKNKMLHITKLVQMISF